MQNHRYGGPTIKLSKDFWLHKEPVSLTYMFFKGQCVDFGWLWYINIGLSGCNKHITLVEDVDNGRGYACFEAGNTWKISLPSSQFCSEPKTAQK